MVSWGDVDSPPALQRCNQGAVVDVLVFGENSQLCVTQVTCTEYRAAVNLRQVSDVWLTGMRLGAGSVKINVDMRTGRR